jgi:GT2 family glycosyltransferase
MSFKDNIIKISIVILNYNTSKLVDKCLESIKKNMEDLYYEVIVVDNNSDDRTIENLKLKYQNVNFYFREINNGFGSGCNYGFSKSIGKYILFLNPDTYLISNIVKDFYDLLESDNKIGVCSTLLEDGSGNLQYCFNDFPSIKWELLELTGYLSNKKIKNMLDYTKKVHNENSYIVVDWAIGACLFIRKDVFEKVNGFDENYFLYYEDTDLQKRISEAGYKIVLLNEKRIKHIGKSSIGDSIKGDKIYFLNMHISKLKYFYKFSGFANVFFIRIINIIAFSLRLLLTIVKYKSIEFKKNRLQILKNIIKIYFTPKTTILTK